MKIKEGGVMDIQKELLAYEQSLQDNGFFKVENIGMCTVFDPEQNKYHPSDLCDPKEYKFIDMLNVGWTAWQAAKAQAVPEKTVKLHLVWNENKDECVGFLDSKDARYTATGDDRGMFGVTALGDYFRDLNDERNEFETQIVMIEAQEPAND